MIVIRQERISRKDIQNNPDCMYLFGDNLERKGTGGQAKEMRGEPNSIGIATKRKEAHDNVNCYMYGTDPDIYDVIFKEFENVIREIDKQKPKAIIVPLDGIGTGIAMLQIRAPKVLQAINYFISQLEYYEPKNIVY